MTETVSKRRHADELPNTWRPFQVPVLLVMGRNHMFGGVEQPFPIVRPRPGAGGRVGIKLYPETQALPFFNMSLDRTRAPQHAQESLFWGGANEKGSSAKSWCEIHPVY